MVTTLISSYGQYHNNETISVCAQIGGIIKDSHGNSIKGAKVLLEDSSGETLQITYSDEKKW